MILSVMIMFSIKKADGDNRLVCGGSGRPPIYNVVVVDDDDESITVVYHCCL